MGGIKSAAGATVNASTIRVTTGMYRQHHKCYWDEQEADLIHDHGQTYDWEEFENLCPRNAEEQRSYETGVHHCTPFCFVRTMKCRTC
jgi:hypothetical protein